jgi:hypothetical protein
LGTIFPVSFTLPTDGLKTYPLREWNWQSAIDTTSLIGIAAVNSTAAAAQCALHVGLSIVQDSVDREDGTVAVSATRISHAIEIAVAGLDQAAERVLAIAAGPERIQHRFRAGDASDRNVGDRRGGHRPCALRETASQTRRESLDGYRAHRTQIRDRVSQALGRVRKAAKERKKKRFTALLHHVDIDLLRLSFYALKRQAAPAVDGVTWQGALR